MPTTVTSLVYGGNALHCIEADTHSHYVDAVTTLRIQTPPDVKVAIIAVANAFRSGKSFLLSLMLQYLSCSGTGQTLNRYDSVSGGTSAVGGDLNGFQWRGGQERFTTGIWMSETPFIRKSCEGNDVAVFLLDTQGTFDLKTAHTLNAKLFGLATLLSSHLIYNVKNQVQADHLEHLTEFAGYGRFGAHAANVCAHNREDPDEEEQQQQPNF